MYAQSKINVTISYKLLLFFFKDLEITKPIRRGQNLEAKHEYGIYESTSCLLPPKREIKRGNWKTDSTSSTASRSPFTVKPGSHDEETAAANGCRRLL